MKKQIAIFLGIASALILAYIILGSDINLLPQIDYLHYVEAARRLAGHNSPYENLEYFSPPWFAILLIPLAHIPANFGMILWLFLSISSVFIAVNIWEYHLAYPKSVRNRFVIAMLFCVAPPSLYVYITGQSSAIVFLSLTCFLLSVGNSWLRLIPMIIGITIKPHLVILPFFVHLVESIRKGYSRIIIRIIVSIFFLVVISTLFYSRWLEEWLAVLIKGDYRGGPGLVSSGYFGFREAGVPIWMLSLPLLYIIFVWLKEGTTPYLLCLSTVSNLLIVPYHRSYDYILLYPASLYILACSNKSAPVLLSKVLLFFSILIIPFSSLVLLSPIFALISLLILRIKSNSGD